MQELTRTLTLFPTEDALPPSRQRLREPPVLLEAQAFPKMPSPALDHDRMQHRGARTRRAMTEIKLRGEKD